MGYFRARHTRESLAIALSTSLQTGNGNESGAVSQGHAAEPGGEDVAHHVSEYQADLEAGWDRVKRSFCARFPAEVRNHTDGLPPGDQTQTETEAARCIVATFAKI